MTEAVGRFPRGSEWRKWDLHIHTPDSVLSNQFGSDWDRYFRAMVKGAIANNIAVVGITDYFVIDGYRKTRELLAAPSRLATLFADELATDPGYLARIAAIRFCQTLSSGSTHW